MTPEHIEALNAIGFAWAAPKGARASMNVNKRLNDEEEDDDDNSTDDDNTDGNTLTLTNTTTTKPPSLGQVHPGVDHRGGLAPAPPAAAVEVTGGSRSLLGTYHNNMQHDDLSTMILPSSLLASSRMRWGAPVVGPFGGLYPGLGLLNRESHGGHLGVFGGIDPLLAARQLLVANSHINHQALLTSAYYHGNNLFSTNPPFMDTSTRLSFLREQAERLAQARASKHAVASHYANHRAGNK